MKEYIYEFRYIFIETNNFNKDYGKIGKSERERLYFDLMLGRGEIIEDTGGLKKIRCGIAGDNGKEGWEVVFTDYVFPDIRVRIYLLLVKFPLDIKRSLSQKQKKELRKLKEEADYYVGLLYEKLKDNDSIF